MHRIERESTVRFIMNIHVLKELERVSRAGRARRPGVGWGVGGAARGVAWGCKTCNENDLHPICTPYVSICLVSLIKYSNL